MAEIAHPSAMIPEPIWSASDDSSMAGPSSSELPYPLPADSNVGLDFLKANANDIAPAFPKNQGLYDSEYEKDACGVGFVCHIKGVGNHKIVSDAKSLLCNMTHRGAIGADARDGDGAGGMFGIPHKFFIRETPHSFLARLPSLGHYAVGNVFLSTTAYAQQQRDFEEIADSLGLRVIGWREVPTDGSILGPAAKSREPKIVQPFVVLKTHYGTGNNSEDGPFDPMHFNRQLYVLRKHAGHKLTLAKGFYICSLTASNIVYKGQLSPPQVYNYFHDLNHSMFESHFALVHSRFSTNTFPSWDRAQPMRWAAHNGEINTVRGNKNWMRAREGVLKSEKFGSELELLYPIIEPGGSDSAAFDNVLELLVVNGVLTLPEAMMLLVPEAWQSNHLMEPEKKAFYQWAACLQEPWDGPALFAFSDGRYCGANLDRNGLRPCRYIVTSDDIMICASEVGCIYVEPEKVIMKGRLKPGRMLLVDTKEGRIVDDKELKLTTARKQPFSAWIEEQMLHLPNIVKRVKRVHDITPVINDIPLNSDPMLIAFGFTFEQLNLLLLPMVQDGKEALGSMGNDSPLACLSSAPRIIYDYFRQLFAQVTNPPIDPIRESIVMSLGATVGPEGNLLEKNASQCNRLLLPSPVLGMEEMNAIKHLKTAHADWPSVTIDITFDKREGLPGYRATIDRVCKESLNAVEAGFKVIILSDRNIGPDRVALSALLATGGVHHFLLQQKKRTSVALMVETGEAREVHHICVLVGYGADAVCPYLVLELINKVAKEGLAKNNQSAEELIDNYRKATDNGILKVMSKMGISTLQSYKGAQIFEALGLHHEVINLSFCGTASRIEGVTFEGLALDSFQLHERAFPSRETVIAPGLPQTGEYYWRDNGEAHINNPTAIANLQDAVRSKNQSAYDAYSKNSREATQKNTLRGMLDLAYEKATPIPIDQVEDWTEVVRRFSSGAMSYGSISMEAHSTLAIAMNRLGAKSNTGEGGEDAERSIPIPGPGAYSESGAYTNAMDLKPVTDSRRSAIKQVASGRFGVTSNYLADADELQIKMAQGAKPGEGGELPGHKVSASIARTRHSTPGVGLISPPPHHDIYSIEDLKQLIYDLKCANPRSRISVKLVSEVGVGIVASGVAKAKADHILISGHDGGTGASRWTGIKYAGLPWELGLAETHQTLVLNNLRGRVTLQTDGNIRTGLDCIYATCLGAEEYCFATTPLIAMGCVMLRKCHLGSCAVGVATQDPVLRAKFAGQPEQVINFFYYVAEEIRVQLARLGCRTINELVGRADLLKVNDSLRTPKTAHLDLSAILKPAFEMRPGAATYKVRQQDHKLYVRLDNKFIDEAEPAILSGIPVTIDCEVVNTDRALGATLSYRVSKKYGEAGLPQDTIHINMTGSAGQSFGCWAAPGVCLELEGDANDYVGKGLSGGRLIVYPPKSSPFKAEENVIIGNTALYGATSGYAYFSGQAAERFAVRNSGAHAVVEGTGDHGCEYMTGGRVCVLGTTGRNFAAGMSGGIAYVLDTNHTFATKVNHEMVELGPVSDPKEIAELRQLIEDHRHFTGSQIADRVLRNFHHFLPKFVKVLPIDYKRVLEEEAAKELEEKARQSVIDLIPSQTASQVDLAATIGIESTLSRDASPFSMSTVELAPNFTPHLPKSHEPAVVDVEDALDDEEKAKRQLAKLDKVRGFYKIRRVGEGYRPARKRVKDFQEVSNTLSDTDVKYQSARCMDCGVAFCQSDFGCPTSNQIPIFNDLVFKGRVKEAWENLCLTATMPEVTGRVCPAPCEGACVAGIGGDAVGIKSIERYIADIAWQEGWFQPRPPKARTGLTVAIVGSGPAGLAAAAKLNSVGHTVTVFERAERAGGLLMYGIPNMKLDKKLLQRRLDMYSQEGIIFKLNTTIGKDISADSLVDEYDAVILATGATSARDLRIPGRDETDDIHLAVPFLKNTTESLLASHFEDQKYLDLKGKDIVVIGGGDTGNDCIGSSVRLQAKSVTNFELLPAPPATRAPDNGWPAWPKVMRVDYGHAEVRSKFGKDPREYCISSKNFVVEEGRLRGINTVRVEWTLAGGKWSMTEVPNSEEFYPADVVFLALGFTGPEKPLLEQFGVKLDPRGNVATPPNSQMSSVPGVFAAGDARRGQSLVVWCFQEGQKVAAEVDIFLTGSTVLPRVGGIPRQTWHPNSPPAEVEKCKEHQETKEVSSKESDSDSDSVGVDVTPPVSEVLT